MLRHLIPGQPQRGLANRLAVRRRERVRKVITAVPDNVSSSGLAYEGIAVDGGIVAVEAQVGVLAQVVRELPFHTEREVVLIQRRAPLTIAVTDEAMGDQNGLREAVDLGIGQQVSFERRRRH